MNDIFQIKDDQPLQLFHKAKNLLDRFREIQIRHIRREENARADVLSKLMRGKEKGELTSVIRQVLMKPTVDCMMATTTIDRVDWRTEIISLIKSQEEGRSIPTKDAKRIARYLLVGEELYKRGFSSPLLKCVSQDEGNCILRV